MKGKIIRKKYFILQKLGQNAFGETFLARDKNRFVHRHCIIKRFRPILGDPKLDRMRRLFHQEASILKRLGGENRQIPQIYEYFMEGEDFYLVREWIEGLTLKQKVERQDTFTAVEVEYILDSILACLTYIHSHGIVYRQLTPTSIVLRQSEDGYLPIPIYFGGVKELETKSHQPHQRNLALANGYEYIPPEQKQGKSVYASDLYSLGLTAIYMLTGRTPAELSIDSQTKQLLWYQEIPDLSIHLVRVINRAICPNIQDRFISAAEMHLSLNSRPVSISMPACYEPATKTFRSSEIKIVATLLLSGFGILGITFMLLNIDFSQFAKDDFEATAYESEIDEITQGLEPSSDVSLANVLKIPTFAVGASQQEIIDFLGEPTKKSKGYWQNSQALLYQDFVPNKVDLGYLTDADTKVIRQTEISFAGSVDLLTIQQTVRQMLQDSYSKEIERQLNQVYFAKSDRQNFEITNRKGVIQRNPKNYIYISIWDEDFH